MYINKYKNRITANKTTLLIQNEFYQEVAQEVAQEFDQS